ncbi:MAG TPA: glycosyltransferase family 2 protein [Candidatus Limnocylindrales bacterium]|nr:glycosyltransferase family 2 protein [Candidatus Limnocylindrales bacterium]
MIHEPGPPILTIVLPVFGVQRLLGECLDSILSFPGKEIEVVAVDDASPDRSGEILDLRAAGDSRLRVIHLPVNGGLGNARNAGLDSGTGQYVWFVDGDDWLPEGSIEVVIDRLALHHPDVLIVDHMERLSDGRSVSRGTKEILGKFQTPLRLADKPELMRLAHSACTKVVRRAFLDELKLRFHDGLYEDAVFSHHLLMAAEVIDVLERHCYNYRLQTGGSITTSRNARHFEVFDQYERLFEIVAAAGGGYDIFRPELFRAMLNHYLVILGNPRRLLPSMRREFFARMVRDYRRFLPPQGFAHQTGVAGLKQRLVERNAYAAYASLRLAYRLRPRAAVIPRQRPATSKASPA